MWARSWSTLRLVVLGIGLELGPGACESVAAGLIKAEQARERARRTAT
jgi:hypothetical protein